MPSVAFVRTRATSIMRGERSIAVTRAPRLVASSRASTPVPQPISSTRARNGTSAIRRCAADSSRSPRSEQQAAIRSKSARITSVDGSILSGPTNDGGWLFLDEHVLVLGVAQRQGAFAGRRAHDQLYPRDSRGSCEERDRAIRV